MKSLASFSDIIPVLDAALRAGGARFELDSKGAAVRWVQRANQARKIRFELEVERLRSIPGLAPSTPWDSLMIIRDDHKVEIRVRKPMPTIFDLEGNPIQLDKPEVEVQGEDLLLEAQKMLGDLT